MRQFSDWRVAQVVDLAQAVAAADRGEFAGDEEVRAVLTVRAKRAANSAGEVGETADLADGKRSGERPR